MRWLWLLGLLMSAGAAHAQTTSQPSDPDAGPTVVFMPRAALRMSAEYLSGDDPRFVWDTNFGGEVDLVDYGSGRLTFLGNYQAMLGDEYRNFDPNQGNYVLAGLSSIRAGGWEVSGVFYHQSRHLSDRPKRGAVDWNMIGGRAERNRIRGDRRVAIRGDLRKTILHSFVDYTWEIDSLVRVESAVAPHVGAFGAGGVRVLGVDGVRNRGTQYGYRAEGGVRLNGRGGATELFVAMERRIDPYQLEFSSVRWFTVGFRLLSR